MKPKTNDQKFDGDPLSSTGPCDRALEFDAFEVHQFPGPGNVFVNSWTILSTVEGTKKQ